MIAISVPTSVPIPRFSVPCFKNSHLSRNTTKIISVKSITELMVYSLRFRQMGVPHANAFWLKEHSAYEKDIFKKYVDHLRKTKRVRAFMV